MTDRTTKPSAWVSHLGARKLELEEALTELARSRTVAAKGKSAGSVRPAYRTDSNIEFSEPPSEELKCGTAALIAFVLIDWFAVKLL